MPLPSIGLPLPPIGLPLPSIGLPPANVTQPPITHGRRGQPRVVFFVPMMFDWQYGYPLAAPAPPPKVERPPEPVTGTLRIDVEPRRLLQVFVNGYYVGIPDDFNELELEVGRYTIELSAPGYQSVKFDVKIDGSRPITYRGELKPIEPKPEAAAAPSTLYYIPGCYLGNVDPKEIKLPETCDLSRLVTRKPSG